MPETTEDKSLESFLLTYFREANLSTNVLEDPSNNFFILFFFSSIIFLWKFYAKLISKINSALQRIKEGTYGFCEETGEPIGLKRLMARPVATLSIEAQERHERDEKIFIDD